MQRGTYHKKPYIARTKLWDANTRGRQHNLCLSRNTLTRNVQYSTQKHPMGSCEARFPWKKIRNSGRGWPHKILYNHFVNPRIPRCLLLEKTQEFWKGCCEARFPWKKMRDPGAVGCSTYKFTCRITFTPKRILLEKTKGIWGGVVRRECGRSRDI